MQNIYFINASAHTAFGNGHSSGGYHQPRTWTDSDTDGFTASDLVSFSNEAMSFSLNEGLGSVWSGLAC